MSSTSEAVGMLYLAKHQLNILFDTFTEYNTEEIRIQRQWHRQFGVMKRETDYV